MTSCSSDEDVAVAPSLSNDKDTLLQQLIGNPAQSLLLLDSLHTSHSIDDVRYKCLRAIAIGSMDRTESSFLPPENTDDDDELAEMAIRLVLQNERMARHEAETKARRAVIHGVIALLAVVTFFLSIAAYQLRRRHLWAKQQLGVATHQLSEKTHQLDKTAQQLDATSHQLDEKTHQLDEKTHQLDEKTHQLDEKTHQLDEKTHQLDEKTHQLDEKMQQLDQAKAHIGKLQQSIANSKREQRAETPDMLFQRIRLVMEQQRPYIDPDFDINALAMLVSSNRTYTSGAINAATGMNFRTWLATYRVQKVKEILQRQPDTDIATLCQLCGYNVRLTLSRQFHQLTGMTVTAYVASLRA